MKNSLLHFCIVSIFALFFLNKNNYGENAPNKDIFDSIFLHLQKPGIHLNAYHVNFERKVNLNTYKKSPLQKFDGSISYEKLDPEKINDSYEYFLYHIAKVANELHPGDIYIGPQKSLFKGNSGEIKLIYIVCNEQKKIDILAH